MKKILPLLEKYVQWGVLGLGVLFLFYMIWSYLYLNPAAKPGPAGSGVALVTPGTVDKVIADGSATALGNKIKQPNSGFHIDVHMAVNLDLGGPATRPTELSEAYPMWDSWAFDVSKLGSGPGLTAIGGKIQNLPALPALNYVDQETVRTVLAVAGTGGVPAHQDQDAVTTFWSLPVNDLAKSFRDAFAAKLRQSQQTAIFVKAVLIRQELDGSGQWGMETEIAALPVVASATGAAVAAPPAYPDPKKPTFADDAAGYKTWAQTNGNEISLVEQPFPAVAIADRPDLQWLPLEAWIPYCAKLAAEAATVVTDVPPPAGAANGAGAPANPPVNPIPAAPPQGGRFGGGGRFIGGGGAPPGRAVQAPPVEAVAQPKPTVPDVGAVVIPPIPKLQAVPGGGFNPTALAAGGDMELFFHDLTVVAGKTYRYKVRYTLWNPAFGMANLVVNPKMAEQFGMDSPDSGWSEAVVVPSRTRFWCQAKQPPGHGPAQGDVGFDVFSWHDGLWQEGKYLPSAGDEIGADEGQGGNFLTHWTLLDVRSQRTGSQARSILLVPDFGGPAQARNYQTDESGQDYKHFMVQFNAQAPAVVPGGTPPPGGPAGGGAVGQPGQPNVPAGVGGPPQPGQMQQQ